MIPRQTLSFKTFATGVLVKGRYVEGADTPATLEASVQPLTPREMELLPEGRRAESSFRLYSDTRLNPAKTGAPNADEVTIEAEQYEVVSVGIWQNRVIDHYKMIVSKKGG